jgi:LacI family sucrose operon transcriptional repressor
MKPTIRDIARLAGVSSTTVSRVMNNRGYISTETRTKVERAMKDLNYHPNDLARSLYHKHTSFIGLIFPTTSNPFFGELIFHIENECAALGYKVLLCNSLNRADKEKNYLEMLQRNQVDGIIVGAHNRHIPDYQKTAMPVVAIDRYLSPKIPVVASDNFEGGRAAANWLLKQGCRHIIHINGPHQLETPAIKRRKGYEQVMRNAGRKPVTYELSDSFDSRARIQIARRIFAEHPEADGIFASDDLIAAAVWFEAEKAGIRVPDQLKVVGYDGTETVRLCMPKLTTIKQPIGEIARQAVKLVIDLISGREVQENQEVILPIELVEGNMTLNKQ